ncbi:hypothetical protein ACHAXT_006457 [Thalassiosira profunda]
MNTLCLLVSIIVVASGSAFCPPDTSRRHLAPPSFRADVSLQLVTEADVIALVEKAEDLYELRQMSCPSKPKRSVSKRRRRRPTQWKSCRDQYREEKLAEANEAQNLSIDLGALLDKAARATTEADELEVMADEALAASEAALEQHLIDFPSDDETDFIQ